MELAEWNLFVHDHHVADPKRTDTARKQMCAPPRCTPTVLLTRCLQTSGGFETGGGTHG
jgi:hypothetical protein